MLTTAEMREVAARLDARTNAEFAKLPTPDDGDRGMRDALYLLAATAHGVAVLLDDLEQRRANEQQEMAARRQQLADEEPKAGT